jgi:chromosome segregation ATPase
MNALRSNPILAIGVALLALLSVSAHAQSARAGGGASAQLLQQMQQLASERTSLQAENGKLKKDLEDMRKERDALKSGQQALERRAKASESSLKEGLAQHQSSDQELAQTKDKLQQLVAKFRETLQTLRTVETEDTTTKQTLTTRDQDLKKCVDRNLALYKLNQEVLAHFESQTVWTRVAQTEPFTRIKRNQLENLLDEYKARADDQKLAPAAPPAGTAP